ncbi:Gfo/Idh/MocA family oxidoreductase [Chloroflexia bacterium SDU3-3]|nr:Gfo/Idh/MocA family oxidoreductase [Chloroflexia bacterium SDU3-3]
MKQTNVGIIGTGNISGIYLESPQKFPNITIRACADIDLARAQAQAEKYGVPKACSVEDLLADPEIDIVINLTIPAAHGSVAIQAIESGKHVYNEKPLAIERDEAKRMLGLAAQKGLRVGCAPDTFLGAGLQTCRKLIDDGAIGEPVGATAFMMSRGPERWHPNPDFFYQPGAGPMFDMGPYYLTALVSLLGPVRRVTGATRVTWAERMITSQPLNGTMMKVNTPTYIAGLLDFASGPVGTIITVFDVYASRLPRIEIYGSTGTLSVPDPNTFGGPVQLWTNETNEWRDVELTHGYAENSRGIGVADMAEAIHTGRTHRASGELAYHVLDLMHSFHDASNQEQHIQMQSTCARPEALPAGWVPQA